MFEVTPRAQSNTVRAPDETALCPPHLLDQRPDSLSPEYQKIYCNDTE
jgi:hypothetical protein